MPHAGIVLELEPNHVVVLGKDGRFLRIPRRPDMVVGMEVEWETRRRPVAPESKPLHQKRAWKTPTWRRVGAAAIAACMVATAGIWFALSAFTPTTAEAYAMVSLDINPSVSMKVSKDLKVTDATGINADGQRLVNQVPVKGKSLQTAISMLVNAAVDDQMMPHGDTILVTTAPSVAGTDVDTIETKAKESVEQAIASSQTAQQLHPTVYALNLSRTVWSAADAAKVSPGKFAAYLMAGQEGVHVSGVNQMTGSELGKVLANGQGQSVSQVLKLNDPNQLAKLIQSLLNSDVVVAQPGPSNASGQPGGSNPPKGSGPKPGKGKGSSTPSGHDGNKHPGAGTATIQIDGTTITIPLGSFNPVVTGKEPEDQHGHGGDHGDSGDDGAHHGDKQNDHSSDGGQGRDQGSGQDSQNGPGRGNAEGRDSPPAADWGALIHLP